MSPAEVRALIASRKRLAIAIQALEQKSGDYLVDLYSDLLNDLLATIGTMTSPAGKAVNLDRSTRIERRLIQALQEYRPRFAGLFEAQFSAGIRTVEDVDLTTFETLREALFQELRAGMEAFRTEGAAALQSAARTRWIQAVDGTSANLVAKLRGEIATGMVSGSSQEQIAQRIAALPEFRHDNLPPLKATPERVFGGRLGTNQALENRARRIARRELAWTANRAHEAWTSEAWPEGRYKNINPLDDNTTDLCERASEQPPMTLEEWDASEFGRAPRGDHVDHCRSLLVLIQETAQPVIAEPEPEIIDVSEIDKQTEDRLTKESDKWWRSLSVDQRRAVEFYSGAGFEQVNGFQRDLIDDIPRSQFFEVYEGSRSSISGVSRDLQSAIQKKDKRDEPMLSWRLLRGAQTPDDILFDAFDDEADEIEMQGMASSTVSTEVLWQYMSDDRPNVVLRLKSEGGAYIDPFSRHESEKELLINNGARYKMVGEPRQAVFRRFNKRSLAWEQKLAILVDLIERSR